MTAGVTLSQQDNNASAEGQGSRSDQVKNTLATADRESKDVPRSSGTS